MMNTIHIEKQHVQLIAHRGCSALETENSIPAFTAAGNRTYYGVETDVHCTADSGYVVIHDSNTGRVACEDIQVEEEPFERVMQIHLRHWSGTRRRDVTVPALEDYIGIMAHDEKTAVVELKSHFSDVQLQEIVDIIRGMGHLDKTIFISFNMDNLYRLRGMLPHQPIQFLTDNAITDALIDDLTSHNMDLDAYSPRLTADVMAKLKAAGIKVNCWTVDDPAEAQRLIQLGVDFITTNILE